MTEFWNFKTRLTDAPALIVPGGGTVSYGELNELADEWKARLLQMAGGRRPMVVLEFATCTSAIGAYLGALRAGLPLLLAEPGQVEPDSLLYQRWQPEIRIFKQSDVMVALQGPPPLEAFPEPHQDLRLLLSTSGSTGDPKLVRLTGRNLDSNAQAIVEYLTMTPRDRAITTLPLFYSYGMSVLNSHLAAGASLVLTERSVVEPLFWNEFREHGATSLALVPHQFDLLERSGFADLSLPNLRYITQAGGKLSPDSVRRFYAMSRAAGWRLVLMYGQTEAAPRISYVPPDALPAAADTIGRAIPGGRLWLADQEGHPISATGVAGELVYGGPNVMMGYAETRSDLAKGSELTELRTGDVAERTADGLFRIVGRIKRFVKLFGLRLSLDQIEVLLREKGIPSEAIAIDDRLVILHHDADKGPAARDSIATAYGLPESAIHIGHLPEVPLLASGKPDQKALRLKAAEVLQSAPEPSECEAESISDVLKQATRSRAAGPSDSFASLGGDSLSYLQVQMALECRLGRAPEGWEHMSLTQLEALVPTTRSHSDRRVVDIDVLLRLAAITLVISQHASDFPLYGGPWMLIAVMGFTASRFKLQLITEGRALRLGFAMLYPILPLYYLLISFYDLLRKPAPMSSFVLLGDYQTFPNGSLLQVYWFVSLYVQIVAVLMLVALIPPVRRQLGRAPWTSAALILVPLLLVESVLDLPAGAIRNHIAQLPLQHYAHQGLAECLPIFVIGWMLRSMKGRLQVIATLSAAVVTVALFAHVSPAPEAVVFLAATVLLLALNPRILFPSSLTRALQQLAALTLFVYLVHAPFVFAIEGSHRLPEFLSVLISIPLSFAVAFLAKAAFDRFDRFAFDFFTPTRSKKSAAA